MILKLILKLLHCAIFSIFRLFIFLHNLYLYYREQTLAKLYGKEFNLDYVRYRTNGLTKRPIHLALIIDEQEVALLDDIAAIVCWTVGARIPYITIFDRKGEALLDKFPLQPQG